MTSLTVDDQARTRWILLLGVSLASFVGCIDFTIVNTAIADIQGGLAATVSEAQWIVAAFVMALSGFMVVSGRLADRYGRRRLFYIGMAAFTLGSLGAGAAPSIEALIGFRFVQGASAAALYTTTAAIVSDAFPEAMRGRALGLLFAANGIGLALGPVAGGVLVELLGWRWVFFVNVPFLLLSAVLCFSSVRETRDESDRGPLDWPGVGLLLAGLASLLLGLTQAKDWGWTAIPTLAATGGGLCLLLLFVVVERRAASPLIRLDLFANRRFAAAGIATFALAFFYCSAFFLMPLYLGVVRGYGSLLTGLMLLPTTALVALASPVVGKLADRHGPMPLLAAGLALLALSASLQMLFSEATSTPFVILAFATMGIGWGCILGPSTLAALSSVPKRLGGVAMGACWTIHNVGGATGLVLSTLLYRMLAEQALQSEAHLSSGIDPAWIDRLVSEPTVAAEQLARLLGGAPNPGLVDDFFTSGYRAAMGLLTAATLLALAAMVVLARRGARGNAPGA
ncbi:MFS transporter [Bosea caraganae]|uniref:MFS transporter n=1 Tax=Bosea caraganae TaxID=2763117 RepID=A0A370LBV6_9HYPH|nr:MFS transporter [Bosea caraganae]RDJ27018.1 MFS transporter [Bosea caraganae]RDJ29035.1 MFS transporter [Bosea caraganae]